MPRTTSAFAAASRASPPWESCRPSSGPRWASRSGSTPAVPGGSHPWESAYHGLHGHRRAVARRPERRERGGRTPNQRRGHLDPDAGRTFPTLWGTPWDTLSRYLCKPMYNKLLAALVALTLPER